MRIAGSTDAGGWRKNLSDYGAVPPAAEPPVTERRRRWRESRRPSRAAGWLVALAAGAAIAALVIFNQDDPRTVGQQLDDAVAGVRSVGTGAGQALTDSRDAAVQASQNAIDGVGTAISDTGISAKIKTALAADPSLSAARITVTTRDGVVRLEGPAPDAAAKERATVLAGAPQGVRGVDNRLALPQPGGVVAVTDGVPAKPQANPASAVAAQAVPAPAQNDAALAAQVKTALGADAGLAKVNIAVSAQQGVVRMDGVVPDVATRERAFMLAVAQPGVKAIDNRLLLADAAQAALTLQ